MSALRLTAAVADYDRVRALVDGSVASGRLRLDASVVAPSEIFYRLLHDGAYDVAEMSLSSYLIRRREGWDYTAIPVFPMRRLFHLGTRVGPAVERPEDLGGRRFGLTEYQVTAAVWTRGTFAEDFGVDLGSVKWVVERLPELSHGGETEFAAPPGITIEQMAAEDRLTDVFGRGGLDAVLPSPYPGLASRLNRSDEQELEASGARPLFDARTEARRYVGEHGFLPLNHTVVVRSSLLEEHPWLAREVFDHFVRAKEAAYANLVGLRRSHLVLASAYLAEEAELFGRDPYPYGFAANEAALRTLVGHSHRQGLIPEPVAPADLFVPELLDS